MKPRSRVERRFCDLANTMQPYSGESDVIEWAKCNVFKKESYYLKHRWSSEIWCQCCGHREPCQEGFLNLWADGWTCPHCGAETDVVAYDKRVNGGNTSVQVTVFDVVDNVQCMRAFEVFRDNVGVPETKFSIYEIYQCWVNDDGRDVITTRRYSRSAFYFRWDYGSEYSIGRHCACGTGAYYYPDIYTPEDNWVYPKMRFSKAMRGVGLTKNTVMALIKSRDSLPEVFSYMMKEPYLESLNKTGYRKLYLYFLTHREKKFLDYRHAVNICHRNRYPIDSPDMWVDYMDDLIELGLDTHNAHYVCPQDLFEAHRKMLARVERKRNKEEFEKRVKDIANEEPKYRDRLQAFFGLCFVGNGFNVVCIKSVKEVFYEAKELHHCMFTRDYYKKTDSLLLSARNTVTGEPIESIEVSLRNLCVLQCRGDHNKKSRYHDKIISVVNKHMPDIMAIANGMAKTDNNF